MLRQDKSTKELKRKADKAIRLKGKIWTVEELDYFEAIGKSWAEFFRQEDEKEIK